MKTFYNVVIIIGVICSAILGYLYISRSGATGWSVAEFLFLLLGIEFGCFAWRDKRHKYGE